MGLLENEGRLGHAGPGGPQGSWHWQRFSMISSCWVTMCWSLAILCWSPVHLSVAQQEEQLAKHRDHKGTRQLWRVTWVRGKHGREGWSWKEQEHWETKKTGDKAVHKKTGRQALSQWSRVVQWLILLWIGRVRLREMGKTRGCQKNKTTLRFRLALISCGTDSHLCLPLGVHVSYQTAHLEGDY